MPVANHSLKERVESEARDGVGKEEIGRRKIFDSLSIQMRYEFRLVLVLAGSEGTEEARISICL